MLAEEGVRASSDDDFEWAMQVNVFRSSERRASPSVTRPNTGSGSMLDVASVNAFFRPDAPLRARGDRRRDRRVDQDLVT